MLKNDANLLRHTALGIRLSRMSQKIYCATLALEEKGPLPAPMHQKNLDSISGRISTIPYESGLDYFRKNIYVSYRLLLPRGPQN